VDINAPARWTGKRQERATSRRGRGVEHNGSVRVCALWQVRKAFFDAARDCYSANGLTTTWITNASEKCRQDVSISPLSPCIFVNALLINLREFTQYRLYLPGWLTAAGLRKNEEKKNHFYNVVKFNNLPAVSLIVCGTPMILLLVVL